MEKFKTLDDLKAAIAAERIVVKVGHSWFLPVVKGTGINFSDGTWLLHIVAGLHQARGFLSNINDNEGGREFRVIK